MPDSDSQDRLPFVVDRIRSLIAAGSAAERTADDFRRKAEKLAAATLRRRRGESLRERP